jgi:hypothetical protein
MLLLGKRTSAQPTLADTSLKLGQLFGLVGEKEGAATTLRDGLEDPGAINGLLHRERS